MAPILKVSDQWRVVIDEPWEVRFWTREFGCTEDALRQAVRAAGPRAGAVRAYLAGHRSEISSHANDA